MVLPTLLQQCCLNQFRAVPSVDNTTDFCGNPKLKGAINFTDIESLYNFYTTLGMTCFDNEGVDKAKIGLIGSMQFAGWTFTSVWVPRLSDLYGRKYILRGALLFALPL